MLRLTVGRRLALVVAFAIIAITIVVMVVLRGQAAEARAQAENHVESVALPVSSFLASGLENAGDQLASFVSTLDDEQLAGEAPISDDSFLAVEVVLAGEPSTLDATENMVDRARVNTVIGSTRSFGDAVAVLIATPLPPIEGEDAVPVLVAAYDTERLVGPVTTISEETNIDVLLTVRNSEGNVVVFADTGEEAGDGNPVGRQARSMIDEVLGGQDALTSNGIEVNGVSSVVAMRRIPGVEWVVVAATPTDGITGGSVPLWLIPAFAVIGAFSLIPIALMRRRLGLVVRGAQELYLGRLQEPLTDESEDEIGIMSRSLQSLDTRLQDEAELRSQSAATLQHRATHDPLTGLANRGLLVENLTEMLRNRRDVAVIFCDIDGFKGINDSQGHEAGDLVLKFVAEQLASAVRPADLIARFGGDEFCVLVRGEPQVARDIAAKVERALDATVVVNDNPLRIGGSVGLAAAKVTDSADSILKNADLAMYREKERRRGLREAARGDSDVEVSTDQIRLVYQPVVNISDGSIIGVEVLSRYMHPVLGLMDPSSFLPPGTERGEFDKFDLEILSRSIAQLSEWLSNGIIDERFTMSFNLLPDHVSDSDSHRIIFDTLRQHRVPPTMLQIEVTEHRLFAHEDDLLNSLNTLRGRGIKVAIDDFGVEGSNVDRLIQIPSDTVKIDRSFVSDIDVDPRAAARLKAILDIVAAEDRVAIAEGVERTDQADILRGLNVPFGQGFLWHAPLSALALTPLLGRASRWTRRKPPATRV